MPAVDAPDPLLNTVVEGRWRIVAPISGGSMGMVYLAERVNLGLKVALKLLHEEYSSSNEFIRRFAREARALSRLQHIHCISILDVGSLEQRPYIVMELVPGMSLGRELTLPGMTPARAVGLVRQILLGLRHAHEHGIVHRDLKPDNIMLTEVAGVGEVVKICDFGFAHIVDSRNSQSNANLVPGTPSYMSPEQAMGLKTDLRTDLYSTGVILYQLVVGRKPFIADDAFAMLQKHKTEAPVPPRVAAPARNISEPLERVILHAMTKDRDQRYTSAEEFQRALEATPEGQRALPGAADEARRIPRAWSRALTLAAIVAVVLGGAAALRARSRSHGHASTPAPVATAAPGLAPAPAPPPGAAELPAAPGVPGATVVAPEPTAAATPADPAEIDAWIAGGRYIEAERALNAAIAARPKDGELKLKRGELYFIQAWRKNALYDWDDALRLQPDLRHDPRLGQHLCASLDERSSEQAQKLLLGRFGSGVVGVMNACIRRTHDPVVLNAAVHVIEQAAGRGKVDTALVARRMLELAPTCEERKRAVETLGQMRSRRAASALAALERERAQNASAARLACLGRSVQDALARVK